MDNKELNLSSPWMIFYHELEALFREDEQVRMRFDNNTATILMYVDDAEKADALDRLLPKKVEFGNITLTIEVIPANGAKTKAVDLFKKAFKGNKVVTSIQTGKTPQGSEVNFVVFKPLVAQFYSDSLSSMWGLESILYEDLAKDIFEIYSPEVWFCTEPVGNDGKIEIQ